MKEAVWARLSGEKIHLNGTDFEVQVVEEELDKAYLPLAEHLRWRQKELKRRLLVGLAGAPGSGKTVTTLVLERVLNILSEIYGDGLKAIALGLDGFHYPNVYLETHKGKDYQGREVSLRAIKGSPPTFDVAQAIALLKRVQGGESVFFPVYSRTLHDPVPGAIEVRAEHRIVLFEGNFLFLPWPPWTDLQVLFDVRLFTRAPRQAILKNLEARHRRGGKSAQAIDRQREEVDLPNILLVEENIAAAEVIVERGEDGQRVTGLTWLREIR